MAITCTVFYSEVSDNTADDGNDRHSVVAEKTKKVVFAEELPRPDTPPDVWYYEGYYIDLHPRHNSPAFDPHDPVPTDRSEPFMNPIDFMERYHNKPSPESLSHGRLQGSYHGKTFTERFRKIFKKRPHDLDTIYSEITTTTQNDDQSLIRLDRHVTVNLNTALNSHCTTV